jgi:hypothetical protein
LCRYGKILEEDEKVQQWDQEEERVTISIQELKQRKKVMSITRVLEGHSGYEEDADRFESSADAEARETRGTGTPPRTSNTDDHIVGGRK